MKFLIAGLGSIGRRHLRNLIALGETDIVLLRSRRATLPDEELAGFPVEDDLQEALKKHRPDGVIVATPTALHLDVAMPAAEAGCNILLEKPVSHSLERLDQLQAALERSGARLLVGFQFRHHPALVKAREWIADGAIGKILAVHAIWGEHLPDWHPWEDYRGGYAARADLGGGVILTLTHPLDYLRFLVGDVESVWSFNGRVSSLEMDVEDSAEIGLRFAGGALGSVHLNYFQRPPVHRFELAGTAGTLRWDNADGVLHLAQPAAKFGESGDPANTRHERYAPPEGFERNDLFIAQIKHFLEVVRGKAEPICTLEDGIQALRLALAAKESQASGRTIALPPPFPAAKQ